MSTTEEISAEMSRYMTANRAKPEHIYLGHKEHRDMQKMAASFGIISGSPVQSEDYRMEYCGMKIYEVDAASFIGFGSAQPSPCG